MRRKPGALLPIEESILHAAIRLWRTGSAAFHGYELAKHVAEPSDRRSLTAYGTLYRALSRLEKMGLLQSRREDPHIAARENRPLRRLYALTALGDAAVEESSVSAAAPSRRPRRRRSMRKALRPASP